jgi:DinB family protein
MLNPYSEHLGGRKPLDVLAGSCAHLRQVLDALGPLVERRPAPGKWSPREIVCHLADCEIVFAFRLRQALAQAHHVIQPFDQDAWAATYGGQTVESAHAVFTTVRQWNLALLRVATAADLARVVTHPERGEMTAQTIVETMAGHDLNHLGQLDAMLVA